MELSGQSSEATSFVYLCTKVLKRRNLQESWVSFGDEDMIVEAGSVIWLPGGVAAYVDVKKDGVLCCYALELDGILMKGSIL